MTTTGFKRRRAEFQDLIYQNLRRVGANSSDTGTIVILVDESGAHFEGSVQRQEDPLGKGKENPVRGIAPSAELASA